MNHNITEKLNGISCIYQIRNITNNKIYIGSTNNLMYRNNYHTNHLRRNDHTNGKLQASWNKHGEENFILEILIKCDQSVLFWYEQQFLDKWKPEYNISKYAEVPTVRGGKQSPEHIEKRRQSFLLAKHHHTEETKIKIGLAGLGRNYSKETHELWSKQRVGHERCAKWHVGLISPEGEVFAPIFNMAKFCRKYNLSRGKIMDIEKGNHRQHHGWTLYQEGR